MVHEGKAWYKNMYIHTRSLILTYADHLTVQIVHYNDGIMDTMASQITSLTIVCSTAYSDADQRKHKSSAPLAFVRRIHRCGEFTETGEFPAQMASNAENVSIWWRHHEWQTHRQLYRMTVNLFGEKYCIWIQQSYVSSEEDHIGSTCILFIENINVHDYFTRQQEKFHVPNTKRNYMQRTISYRGIIVWNHITKHITYYRSLLSFKFALWKYVIDGDILLDSV